MTRQSTKAETAMSLRCGMLIAAGLVLSLGASSGPARATSGGGLSGAPSTTVIGGLVIVGKDAVNAIIDVGVGISEGVKGIVDPAPATTINRGKIIREPSVASGVRG